MAAATAVPGSPAAAGRAAETVSARQSDGIWIGREELQRLPTSGAAWGRLTKAAAKSCSQPDLEDQDDPTNICVMAKALVAARTGSADLRDDVLEALSAISNDGSYNGRALALGRELAAYVIAADLIDLRSVDPGLDAQFRSRIKSYLTVSTSEGPGSLIECHEERPNNWGTHCGGSRAAVAAYLGDQAELERTATVFKGWLGDRGAYAGFKFSDGSWQCDPRRPVAINPAGCIKNGVDIDGVLPDDQRRGGTLRWPPAKENYVYEALQGALAQAVILNRAGYDTFGWESQALLRAFTWLHNSANYPATGDDTWEVYIVNQQYGTRFPVSSAKPGKNIGWTDWTHAN
jgi:hypothetical protein